MKYQKKDQAVEIKNPIKKFETNNNAAISTNIYEKFLNRPFPFEQLPDMIRITSQHIAETRALPPDMVAMMAIGVTAGALGDSFLVQNACEPFQQLPNLYLFGVGATCSGKSAGLEPLIRYWRECESPPIKVETLEGGTIDSPRTAPREFMFENGTCEGITRMMLDLNAPLFGINSEGREIIDIMNGAYKKSNGTEVGFYCKAWSGEPVDSIRASRSPIRIPKAVLSILWLAQPDVFRKAFVESESAMLSGLIGRFLFFKGLDRIPFDDGNRPKENSEIMNTWAEFLENIFNARREEGQFIVEATSEGREIFRNFHNKWVEAQNGPLHKYTNVIGRAREQAIRISISLAVAENGEITPAIAETACRIVDYSYSVLLEAFLKTELDAIQIRRENFISFFRARNCDQMTYGEIQRYLHCKREEIDEIVAHSPDIFEKTSASRGGSYLKLLPGN